MSGESEKHISYYSPTELFIVELSAKSVNLIAQLLHIYNICKEDNKIGKEALESLVNQTSCAFHSRQIHGVYTSQFEAPPQCDVMKPIYYLPYE